MPIPHPLARRIHDRVLQLLGVALLKAEMCEELGRRGQSAEILDTLLELRATLEETVDELRSIMSELRALPAEDQSLKNQAA